MTRAFPCRARKETAGTRMPPVDRPPRWNGRRSCIRSCCPELLWLLLCARRLAQVPQAETCPICGRPRVRLAGVHGGMDRSSSSSRHERDVLECRREQHPSRYSPPRRVPKARAFSAPAKKKKKTKKRKNGGGGSATVVAGPVVPGVLTEGEGPDDGLPAPPTVRSETRSCSHDARLCFNYGIAGHFPSECPALPRCLLTLEYLGHIVDGGFYYINMPLPAPPTTPLLATVTVVPGQDPPPAVEVTAEIIAEELRDFIGSVRDESFTWEVRETSPSVFSVTFPSEEMLRLCIRFDVIPFVCTSSWSP